MKKNFQKELGVTLKDRKRNDDIDMIETYKVLHGICDMHTHTDTDTHTHTHTSNENRISAIHSVHLAEIVRRLY